MKKTILLLSNMLAVSSIFAQGGVDENQPTEVLYPVSFSISRPLSELAAEQPYDDNIGNNERVESHDRDYRQPMVFLHSAEDGPEYGNDPATIQRTMGTKSGRAPLTDWAGQSGGGYPPDPSGAAGLNHYVQSVNATPVKVFNKTTGANLLTVNMGTLWTPATGNAGDPVVLYDRYADRWFVAQFATPPSTNIYLGVSKTPDPTGQYYTWTFSATQFPDYLKFSIWHDGYYMTSNQSSDRVYVFERAAMLTGSATARMASTALTSGPTGQGASFFCPLPADADGGLPTSGPCPLVYPVDNAWGATADGIRVRDLTTVWGTTPSLTISTGTVVATSAHDMSYNSSWNDIPQPGTSAMLDGIGGVATFRAQWRKWAGYNTMVIAFAVKVSATQRSSKWVELRQTATGQPWTLYQEGLYSPDTRSRWVPSIAMDDYGNIGMSYARCSGAAGDYASCGYTGRCKNDPLGQMTIAETMVPGATGTHSQTANNRFGDYGQTSVDPSPGKGNILWSTMEYLAGGTPKTRVWSYGLGCPVGINDSEVDLAVYNIYQSGDLINVEASLLKSNESTLVDLFDITGKQISSNTVKPVSNSIKTTISVNGLSAGTYLVRIGNEEYQNVTKVFVK